MFKLFSEKYFMTPNYPNSYPLYYKKVNIVVSQICHNFDLMAKSYLPKPSFFICRLGNCSLPMDNPLPSHLTLLMSEHA